MMPPEMTTAAAAIALQSAAARLQLLGWTNPEIIDAASVTPPTDSNFVGRIREAVRASMPAAQHDYEEAMRARMPAAAVATFQASAVLAGIDAANGYHQAQRPARVEHPTDPDGIALHLPDAPSIGIDV